jgi:hypothetical protein
VLTPAFDEPKLTNTGPDGVAWLLGVRYSSRQYMHDSDSDAVASRWTRCYWICKSPHPQTFVLVLES